MSSENASLVNPADSAHYELRLFRLEREAEIAAFHRNEAHREQAVLLVAIQAGLALAGLIYAGLWLGWLPGEAFAAGGTLSGYGIAAIATIMLASALLGLRRLMKSGRAGLASAHHPELAE